MLEIKHLVSSTVGELKRQLENIPDSTSLAMSVLFSNMPVTMVLFNTVTHVVVIECCMDTQKVKA